MAKVFEEMNIIANIVAEEFHVTPKEMFSKSRKRSLVYARQVFHYICKRKIKETLFVIGKFSEHMGREEPHDHATVLYGHKCVSDLTTVDKIYRAKIERIEDRVERELLAYKEKDAFQTLKNRFVEDIFMRENGEFIEAVKTLVYRLSKNRDTEEVNKLLQHQYELENGGIRQATQSDNTVGVV